MLRYANPHPSAAPHDGQHQALDEQLPNQQPAAGPERRPDGHLFLARGRAREQHVRDVGARNQQQNAHRRKKRVQRRPELANEPVNPAHDVDGELGRIVVGIDLRNPARDDVHFRGGLLERDPPLQLRLKHDVATLLRRIRTVDRHGLPEIGALLRETRRHHAHAGRWHAVDHKHPTHDARIHAVLRDPHLLRHHEYRRGTRLDIGRDEPPAELWRHAEEPERIRRHQAGSKLQCAVFRREKRVFEATADDIFEDLTLLLIVEKFRSLKCRASTRLGSAGVANLDVRNAIDV